MKVVKYIALCAFLAIGMFYVVVYSSSCNKDACKGVTCLNQGKCNGGNCTCDTGTGGSNCQTIYRELYANSYLGNAVVTYSHLDSAQVDSGYFNHTDDSNVISFSIGSDSSYSLMRLTSVSYTHLTLPTNREV